MSSTNGVQEFDKFQRQHFERLIEARDLAALTNFTAKWHRAEPANLATYLQFTVYNAASIGDTALLESVLKSGCGGEHPRVCQIAAGHGQLECLTLAHTYGCPWEETCFCAAQNGHLACLQFAHTNGCPWDSGVCTVAARGGHLDCLKYAFENGCLFGDGTCYYAAGNGHVECLCYALDNGHPCDDLWDVLGPTCSVAAMHGRLDCLKVAHAFGGHLNFTATSNAINRGHLDCLHYLLTNGCPCLNPRRAAALVARGLLWPKVRLASRVRHWYFAFMAAQHGTKEASLARALEELAADEDMRSLVRGVKRSRGEM